MDEKTRHDIKTKAGIAVVLAQRDHAQDQWAQAAGEIAALQCELSEMNSGGDVATLKARISELETTVKEKDEQIIEQSNTIVALRAQSAIDQTDHLRT